MKSLAWVVALGLLVTLGPVSAQDQKTPTIKEVMEKLHKGSSSSLSMLGKELKRKPTPWEEIQRSTKDFVIFGAALAKNDPPRGDKASWQRLAQEYYETAKAMDEAASSKQLAAVNQARGRLTKSCKACHDAHRGE